MIQIQKLSTPQQIVSVQHMEWEQMSPKTWFVNLAPTAGNFPNSGALPIAHYKTFTWTPDFDIYIAGFTFGASFIQVVVPGGVPTIFAQVSFNSTAQFANGTFFTNSGGVLYHKTLVWLVSGGNKPNRQDSFMLYPYSIYLQKNTSLYIHMGGDFPASGTIQFILSLTLHTFKTSFHLS